MALTKEVAPDDSIDGEAISFYANFSRIMIVETPTKLPFQLETAFEACYIVSRGLYVLSLIACICSAWEHFGLENCDTKRKKTTRATLRPVE